MVVWFIFVSDGRERGRHDRLREGHQQFARRLSCTVCHSRVIDTVFLPCGHLATCETCARTVTNCPLCNDVIQGAARVQMG